MAAIFADPSKLVLLLALVALCKIIELLLDFLKGSTARTPAFDAVFTAVILTLLEIGFVVFVPVSLVFFFVLYVKWVGAQPVHPVALLLMFVAAVELMLKLMRRIIGNPLMAPSSCTLLAAGKLVGTLSSPVFGLAESDWVWILLKPN